MPTPQKIKCFISDIVDYGNQVYSLSLIPERKIPKFTAGQFLHFTIDNYDPSGFWPESRVFSIASPPRERKKVKITYSVKGKYTARMEKELRQGMSVWIKMPYGEFIIKNNEEIVLIAGGTGITAFTAFIEEMDKNHMGSVLLVYGAKTSELLIYQHVLESCACINKNLRILYFVENQTIRKKDYKNYDEISGIISVDKILPSVRNIDVSKFYLSGPPQMIETIKAQLIENCIPSDHIYIDAWE